MYLCTQTQIYSKNSLNEFEMYYNTRPKSAPKGITIVCFHPKENIQFTFVPIKYFHWVIKHSSTFKDMKLICMISFTKLNYRLDCFGSIVKLKILCTIILIWSFVHFKWFWSWVFFFLSFTSTHFVMNHNIFIFLMIWYQSWWIWHSSSHE